MSEMRKVFPEDRVPALPMLPPQLAKAVLDGDLTIAKIMAW